MGISVRGSLEALNHYFGEIQDDCDLDKYGTPMLSDMHMTIIRLSTIKSGI